MGNIELKVTRIGNSRGVRLPAATLQRFGIGDAVLMEELSDGILLRPVGSATRKLSWADTAAAMAASGEDWIEWEIAAHDGLESIPWSEAQPRRVAERAAPSPRPRRKR